jgi:hypothetical protein
MFETEESRITNFLQEHRSYLQISAIIISFIGTEHNGLTESVNYTQLFKFRIL